MAVHTCIKCGETYETKNSIFSNEAWANSDFCKSCWHPGLSIYNYINELDEDSKEAIQAQERKINTVSATSRPIIQQVVVTDINMSFDSMVIFMVKWVLASIPAFIILAVIFSFAIAFVGSI